MSSAALTHAADERSIPRLPLLLPLPNYRSSNPREQRVEVKYLKEPTEAEWAEMQAQDRYTQWWLANRDASDDPPGFTFDAEAMLRSERDRWITQGRSFSEQLEGLESLAEARDSFVGGTRDAPGASWEGSLPLCLIPLQPTVTDPSSPASIDTSATVCNFHEYRVNASWVPSWDGWPTLAVGLQCAYSDCSDILPIHHHPFTQEPCLTPTDQNLSAVFEGPDGQESSLHLHDLAVHQDQADLKVQCESCSKEWKRQCRNVLRTVQNELTGVETTEGEVIEDWVASTV